MARPPRRRTVREAATRALLVDGAGTVFRLAEPPARVYARIAEAHGLRVLPDLETRLRAAMAEHRPPPLEGVRLEDVPEHEREGWRCVVRRALGNAAAGGPVFEALLDHYARAAAWTVEPGAPEALDRARAGGIRTALVTNLDARLSGLLVAFDLDRRFDAVASPATAGRAKPDARIFLETLRQLGVDPEAALYIGDRERDCLEAARRAGLRTIRYDPRGVPARGEVLVHWSALPTWLGLESA